MTKRFERVETRYVERRKSDGKFWDGLGHTENFEDAQRFTTRRNILAGHESITVKVTTTYEIEDTTEGETNAEHAQ